MDIDMIMRHNGGIARTSRLLDEGVTRPEIARAVDIGSMRRIQRGWYATGQALPEVVRAVQCGGRVGCATALRLQGVWMMRDPRLHVCIDPGGKSRPTAGIVTHWRRPAPHSEYPMDDVATALQQLARCRPLREVVVAADSVLNRQLATVAEVSAGLSTSALGRLALRYVDAASESGLESLARVALAQLRIGVRSQVKIPGVGHVDLLIGDRLVLELDGERWHGDDESYEKDRARDAVLVAAGYVVIRCSYRQVMESWSDIEGKIVALVRRREHLWRAPHRRLGHTPRNYRRS
jgi:very-short-patch-repair endonuclease